MSVLDYLESSLLRLFSWIEAQEWQGIDHYDIMDSRLFRPLLKTKPGRIFSILLLDTAPGFLRSITRTHPKRNPKAVALLAQAYLDYFAVTGDDNYRAMSLYAADWLVENASPGYRYPCWGYPFNWQADSFLPAYTPSGVVTAHVIDALLSAYRVSNDRKYLDTCAKACGFFKEYLRLTVFSRDEVSFSYTPYDQEVCHNASLLVAAAIFKTAAADSAVDVSLAGKAVRFVMNQQNDDGSWYYAYPVGRIDPYHTGFVLRSLFEIHKVRPDVEIPQRIERGLRYFERNLFDSSLVPYFRVGRKYPVDIHSCAEGILCFSELASFDGHGLEKSERTARWTIDHMQDKEGFFYYRKYPMHTVKIAYFRWAQAWMARALASLILRNRKARNTKSMIER
ncbi:MAG TPA: hypothetical protein VLX91_12745 [Candidatus Acidoferrales bacterium]|nr:hypothetical protein [Candidatus Acidoferrales bacterium]